MADPPEWLSGLLDEYREDPDRLAESTCRAITAHLFDIGERDTPDGWRDVVPILEESKRHAGVLREEHSRWTGT